MLRAAWLRAPRATNGLSRQLVQSRSVSSVIHSRIQRVQESFFKPVDRVVINVPATTSNLGPGFDSFGFALDVWNRIIVERADKFSMTITGEGSDRLDCSEDNMIPQMTYRALRALGCEVPPLRFECMNAVPPTRGMGSSSAALVAGLAAGLAFGGNLEARFFGLWLRDDLETGRSDAPCVTYGNAPCLASSSAFELDEVELWATDEDPPPPSEEEAAAARGENALTAAGVLSSKTEETRNFLVMAGRTQHAANLTPLPNDTAGENVGGGGD